MRKHLKAASACALVVAVGVIAAVSTSAFAGTKTHAAPTQTLTAIALSKPANLDPSKNGIDASDDWFSELAYASLIKTGAKGKLEPGLATSWGYVGSGNRKFQLTIRSGVKFADGTPLTAAAVAKSLNYARKSTGPGAGWISAVTSVTATGPNKVIIKLNAANPLLPYVFSTPVQTGDIINPKALANPAALGNSTAGAGPYVLDTSQTVSGDHYTYIPNKYYYDPSAIHYAKIVIKVVPDANSALQALRAGEANVMVGNIDTVPTAKSAGLRVTAALVAQTGVDLLDRTGAVTKALGDERVRQALQYAIDRKTIAKALVGSYGQAVNQVGTPNTSDYVQSAATQYAYNPAKAKQLLAAAGYPNGFTTNMSIWSNNPPTGDVAQAIISDWAKIGVTVNATSRPDVATWAADASSKKFALFSYGYGYIPFFLYSQNFYLPIANPWNPWGSGDPQLTALIDKGNAAGGAKQTALYSQATKRELALSWVIPVASYSVFYYTSPNVVNVEVDPARPLLNITELTPRKK